MKIKDIKAKTPHSFRVAGFCVSVGQGSVLSKDN